MKAIVQDAYGSADVLRLGEIERPEVADHEVLLRVDAADVNRGAWHLMIGVPYVMRVWAPGCAHPRLRCQGPTSPGMSRSSAST